MAIWKSFTRSGIRDHDEGSPRILPVPEEDNKPEPRISSPKEVNIVRIKCKCEAIITTAKNTAHCNNCGRTMYGCFEDYMREMEPPPKVQVIRTRILGEERPPEPTTDEFSDEDIPF